MKKLLFLFVALVATTTLWASNTITYTATEKLPETTNEWSVGLHTNAFNVEIISHEFSNGVGTITFAGEVTTIGWHAFYSCSDLTSIVIPNSVTTIGERAFQDCRRLTSVTIGNSVTTIGEMAFFGCSGLTSVTIPNSVTTIGNSAFSSCSGLTSITIPNSVTTIGNYAFSGCNSLTSIDIPKPVTTIGERAFYHCYFLTSVIVHWTDVNELPIMEDSVFASIAQWTSPSAATLHVPAGTKSIYEAADQWKDFGTILDDATALPNVLKHYSPSTMHKVLRNGQILLERNNATYTLMGQKVK